MGLLPNADAVWELGTVGDWAIQDASETQSAYIFLRIPGRDFPDRDETRGQVCALPIHRTGEPRPKEPAAWEWDGSYEAPTLSPSILHHGLPEWHGYLRAGKLVTA